MEISQLRSGWLSTRRLARPERTMDFHCPFRTDFIFNAEPGTVCRANFRCPVGTYSVLPVAESGRVIDSTLKRTLEIISTIARGMIECAHEGEFDDVAMSLLKRVLTEY
jgi:hypothetical protein